MPLVSVIMPVYNGEAYLAEAIESILWQTFADFELLIVDDASQDRSLEIVRDYEERDDRIRSFPLDANVGIADAQNVGIAAARGEYISVMGQDDVSLPERMLVQSEFLKSQPRVGAVGTRGLNVDEDLNKLHVYDVPTRHGHIVLNMFIGASLIAPTVMIRRKHLTAAGGYEAGRRAADDLELYSRLLWTTDVQFANV